MTQLITDLKGLSSHAKALIIEVPLRLLELASVDSKAVAEWHCHSFLGIMVQNLVQSFLGSFMS